MGNTTSCCVASSPKHRRSNHSRLEPYGPEPELSREDTGCNLQHISDRENLDGKCESRSVLHGYVNGFCLCLLALGSSSFKKKQGLLNICARGPTHQPTHPIILQQLRCCRFPSFLGFIWTPSTPPGLLKTAAASISFIYLYSVNIFALDFSVNFMKRLTLVRVLDMYWHNGWMDGF